MKGEKEKRSVNSIFHCGTLSFPAVNSHHGHNLPHFEHNDQGDCAGSLKICVIYIYSEFSLASPVQILQEGFADPLHRGGNHHPHHGYPSTYLLQKMTLWFWYNSVRILPFLLVGSEHISISHWSSLKATRLLSPISKEFYPYIINPKDL